MDIFPSMGETWWSASWLFVVLNKSTADAKRTADAEAVNLKRLFQVVWLYIQHLDVFEDSPLALFIQVILILIFQIMLLRFQARVINL